MGTFNDSAATNVSLPTNSVFRVTSNATIWLAVYALICGFGIILNCFLLVVILTQRKLQTGSGWLIAHKQILDVILCAIIFPIMISPVINLYVNIEGLTVNCVWAQFVQLTLMQVGYWTAFFLGVNRLFALLLPHKYSVIAAKPSLVGCIAFSWFIVLVCDIPTLFNIGMKFGVTVNSCGILGPTDNFTYIVMTAFGQYIPVVLSGVIYITIFLTIRIKMSSRVGAAGQRSDVSRRRVVIAKLLFASYIWNTVCSQLPIALIQLVPRSAGNRALLSLWLRTIHALEYAANPMFFLLLSDDYQQGSKQLLNDFIRSLRTAISSCLLFLYNRIVVDSVGADNRGVGGKDSSTRGFGNK
ncbi:green-sensitive opsin-1-like [Paramacrobiotus metropolitanus]|uniref:green-sensitive opsin-1-like n=1 Tax=Paramacrobiotus metropolitanus TaxID=2943436 RepID=UPI002445A05E|nr:green-sensitive opsin-1-like [Paramacrobiotus metropolitanus]